MKKIITILAIAFTLLTANAQLSSGLIAHYPFNNSLNDISNSANNGTVTSGDYRFTKDRNANPSSALEFFSAGTSGTVGYMDANISSAKAQTFTLSFWINPSDSGAQISKSINSARNAAGDWVWSVEQFPHNDTAVRIAAYAYADKTFTTYASDFVYCKKAWTFLTVVFAGSDSLHIFMNGKKTSSKKVTFGGMTGVPATLRFGHTAANYVCPFNPIDEFRLYNRKLSDAEVTELYAVSSLAMVNLPLKYHFTLFPNPAKNSIAIKGVDLQKKTVVVVSNEGKVINVVVDDNKINLNLLSAGIYNLIIKSELGEIEAIEKFVKE